MSDNSEGGLAATRSRRVKSDKNGRLAALERLKYIKDGKQSKYDLKEEQLVYEEVDEDEYSKIVQNRQAENWLVGDDASGYVDDGREIFDDDVEDDDSAEAAATKPKKKSYKAPTNLSKSCNIRDMFLAAPQKRKIEDIKIDDDELLKNIVQEVKLSGSATTSTSLPFSLKPKKAKKRSVNVFSVSRKSTETINDGSSVSCDVTSLVKSALKEEVVTQSLPSQHTLEDVGSHINTETVNEAESSEIFESIDMTNFDCGATTPLNDKENVLQKQEAVPLKHKIEIPEWNGSGVVQEPDVSTKVKFDVGDLPLVESSQGDKVLRFYWLDMYEEGFRNTGTVYMFGKVATEKNGFISCCLSVQNINRRMFFLPRKTMNAQGEYEYASMKNVYEEVKSILVQNGIRGFKCKTTEKSYYFPSSDIPKSAEYLEVVYPATQAPLNPTLSGETFSRVFGTQTSNIESLILERRLKGPSWIEIRNVVPSTVNISWCKLEVSVDSSNCISVCCEQQDPPPLVIAAIHTRVLPTKSNQNELVMISLFAHNEFPIDKAPPTPRFQSHCCLLTKPSDGFLPYDISEKAKNSKITQIHVCDTEREMISFFLAKLWKIDADIIVGHDISAFDIGVVLSACQRHKIAQTSRLGRLRKSNLITSKGDKNNLIPGRLICDTKVSARELINSRSYDLADLVESVLGKQHCELTTDAIRPMFDKSDTLLQLASLTMMECDYVLGLMSELNVLPLALQITSIAGNLMCQTLLKGRSIRNEYLLLHAFADRNYICPDKTLSKKATKDVEAVTKTSGAQPAKSKAQYSGGLVLEPKKGFYDTLILLMDFNSLYPSIIQEYNLCFTTVRLKPREDTDETDWEAVAPDSKESQGILPCEIKKLVQSRAEVKKLAKAPRNTKEQLLQYDIRQKALKLTANSMYGCLGFSGSRFYAKPIAALITQLGRQILTKTKSSVEQLGLEVIYGDTDSIMVNSQSRDVTQVMKIGKEVKALINKSYAQLEIEIDGVYKRMLLLKKKKYAALNVTFDSNGNSICKKEVKGLDIVRRDWSEIARKAGNHVVDLLLSDMPASETLDAIHDYISSLSQTFDNNELPLDDYVINKQLTKNPSEYGDVSGQPHVLVALRLNAKGGRQFKQGDIVPYVVCLDGTTRSAMQRSYHPSEVNVHSNLTIDFIYYRSQQVLPVVSRLIEPIEGTDEKLVARFLGLDPNQYGSSGQMTASAGMHQDENDDCMGISSIVPSGIDSEFFDGCLLWNLSCPNKQDFEMEFKGLFKVSEDDVELTLQGCPKCRSMWSDATGALENQLYFFLYDLEHRVEACELMCEDATCNHSTIDLTVSQSGFPECLKCNNGSLMKPVYTDAKFYRQLKYMQYLFDVDENLKMLPKHLQEKALSVVDESSAELITALKDTVQSFLQRSPFVLIDVSSISNFVVVMHRSVSKHRYDDGLM